MNNNLIIENTVNNILPIIKSCREVAKRDFNIKIEDEFFIHENWIEPMKWIPTKYALRVYPYMTCLNNQDVSRDGEKFMKSLIQVKPFTKIGAHFALSLCYHFCHSNPKPWKTPIVRDWLVEIVMNVQLNSRDADRWGEIIDSLCYAPRNKIWKYIYCLEDMKLFQTESVKIAIKKIIKEYEQISYLEKKNNKKRPICEYIGKTLKLL